MTPDEMMWHRAYRNWHDHDQAGNRIRAAAWGWIADRIVGRLR